MRLAQIAITSISLLVGCAAQEDKAYRCEGSYYKFENTKDEKQGLVSSLLISNKFVENDAIKYELCEKLKSGVKFSSDCSNDKASVTGAFDSILMNLYLTDRVLQINATLRCKPT